jgi:hypothetical protein
VSLNEMFRIETRVQDAATGAALPDAELEVDVGMPHHGHGMTTVPETRREADGRFVTEGCRLHMFGDWELRLQVIAGREVLDQVRAGFEFRP